MLPININLHKDIVYRTTFEILFINICSPKHSSDVNTYSKHCSIPHNSVPIVLNVTTEHDVIHISNSYNRKVQQ